MSERMDLPGPLLRRGPRPLMLHLTFATLKSRGCAPGSTLWNNALANWSTSALRPSPAAPAGGPGGGLDPEPVSPGLLSEALRADPELIAGIAAYRRHPWRRELPDPPCRWREGGSRLLDYGGSGPLVLFVPSLVNRSHVLDLAPGHAMLRWLAANGLRPLLLEWGWPDEEERRFTLTDYVAGRLERALVALGEAVILAGYCMGGLLAVAAALRRPELVRGLALLATPWDFHAAAPERARAMAVIAGLAEPMLAFHGALPIDALQTLFLMLDPPGVATKYRAFARLAPDSERARLFVALEDWLNDGVPLAAPVARECMAGWYGANTPGRREWRVAGLPVDPGALRVPAFVAIPSRDRIVPAESARPLAAAIPGARLHEPAAGHVGMVAGRSAEAVLWRPFADWARGP
jgi:polyhydroxyalkanoate synthase